MKLLALTIYNADGDKIPIKGVGGMPQGGPGDALPNIVSVGLDLLVLTAVILCLFYLIWGGINWMMSEGDKERLNKARQKIVFSIIGLGIVFISFLIINVFYAFFLGKDVSPFVYGH